MNGGGDHAAASSASATVPNAVGMAIAWTSGAVAADVKGWLNAPRTNNGWILIADSGAEAPTAKRFASPEFATLAQKPTLTITYDVPPGR